MVCIVKEDHTSRFNKSNILMTLLLVGVIIASFGTVGFGGVLSQAQVLSNPLPFDLPIQAALKGSPKKVFANYFPPCPISLDNLDSSIDYYTTQYLNPNGENGNWAADGGVLRERPLPRAVDPSPDWQLNDMKTEVSRATSAGLDGFTYDLLALDGVVWDRLNLLLQAVQAVDPNFKIMLMPDGTAPATSDAELLAAKIASIASSPALSRLSDGRLVISPFAPEVQGATWWSSFVNIMQTAYGIPVAFVPTFLNYQDNAAAFAPFSYGFSNWGDRTPATNTSTYLASLRDDAHSRGKIWMQAVSVQDNRPRSRIYWEANNTENLRATWAAAISGADWVQIPTWNDYTENTQVSPATHIGWGPLDITSYYLTQFKQGVASPITRDVVYVSHRIQSYGLVPTNQTQLMNLSPYSSAPRDAVEVLSFLTTEANVTVRIGTEEYNYSAPAGVFAMTYPLAMGSIHVSVSRSGHLLTDVSSKSPIVSTRATQDLQYYFVSSSRDGKVY
jgi:hypothetical protein